MEKYGPLTAADAAVLFGRVRPLQLVTDAGMTEAFAVFAPLTDGSSSGWQASRAIWQQPGKILALGWEKEACDVQQDPPVVQLLDVRRVPPLLLLLDATQRLRGRAVDIRSDACLTNGVWWNAIHKRARLLSVFYGTVYFISRSIASHLAPGNHFFSVDGNAPVRMCVSSDGRIDGCVLSWRVQRGYEYARLRGKPLYLLASVDSRAGRAMAAQTPLVP
jgi:hypothetical protein